MDLLKRYYDKLILGILLLALVVSMVVLSSALNAARASVEINDKEILDKIYDKPKLAEIDLAQFDAKVEADKDRLWTEDPVGEDSMIMGPGKYVFALDKSGYLLHLSDKKNDFTQSPDIDSGDTGELPPDAAIGTTTSPSATDSGADADKDSLPDAWEIQHGLSPQAFDQFTDNDRDGFSAIEEFRAKTNPNDQKSHPPLATLARFFSEAASPFPYELRKVTPTDPNDKTTWIIDLRMTVNGRSKDFLGRKLNAVLPHSDFRIMDAELNYRDFQGVKLDNHRIIVESKKTGEKVTLPTKKRVTYGAKKVVLAYVLSPSRLKRYEVAPGGTLTLPGYGGVSQTYTLSDSQPYTLKANGLSIALRPFNRQTESRRIQPSRPAPMGGAPLQRPPGGP